MILGIDLGTTNSAACIWNDGQHQLIPNVHGTYLTPSVVSIDKQNTVLIGEAAKSRLITHPNDTASQFKRAMGTKQIFTLGKREFNAVELSSLVLKNLRADAEAFLETTISQAVISVPAYFNDQQRKATAMAAELAGLEVMRLVNEPTAAAIAYGLNDKQDDFKYLVLDLGGGTFDVTLLEFFDNVMEVHASAGDNFLGGEDFTQALVEDLIKRCDLQTPNQHTQQILYSGAEKIKRALTAEEHTDIVLNIENKDHSLNYTRTEFEALTKRILRRILKPVERVVSDANIQTKEINKVVLVGGASRMPSYRKAVSNMLKQLPHSHLDPDLVVAIGAGIQAGLKEDAQSLKEVVLTDVAPYSLGVEVYNELDVQGKVGGFFDPIIERNTVVPVSRVSSYFTVANDQEHILLRVYQGESRYARNNLYLGELNVPVPKSKAGEEEVEVRFSYDMSGLLDIDVLVSSTKKKLNLLLSQHDVNMLPVDKKETLKKLAKLKHHPRDEQRNQAFGARLNACYEMKLGEERDLVGRLIDHWSFALHSQDISKIDIAREALEKELEQLEGTRW